VTRLERAESVFADSLSAGRNSGGFILADKAGNATAAEGTIR
jgi:sulfate adenylyltransferase subunit 1 (EFTu-like GTPase family)